MTKLLPSLCAQSSISHKNKNDNRDLVPPAVVSPRWPFNHTSIFFHLLSYCCSLPLTLNSAGSSFPLSPLDMAGQTPEPPHHTLPLRSGVKGGPGWWCCHCAPIKTSGNVSLARLPPLALPSAGLLDAVLALFHSPSSSGQQPPTSSH